MNSGVIASRYAKALLKYVQDAGTGEKVYSQVELLVIRMEEIGRLKDVIENHDELSDERRIGILSDAAGGLLDDALVRFVRLVSSHRRLCLFVRMLHSFLSQYRQTNGIKLGKIITAFPAEGLREKLESAFSSRTGFSVRLSEEIRPEIIGGFVFELEDYRLDASVEKAFRRIGSQLIEKNNRIV